MFRFFYKKLRFGQALLKHVQEHQLAANANPSFLSHELNRNLMALRKILGTSDDIIMRQISFGYQGQIRAALIFVDGLTDTKLINESIIKPLMYDSHLGMGGTLNAENMTALRNTMLSVGNVEQTFSIDEAVEYCLSGDTIFLIDGSPEALIICARGWETRGVEESKTESVVRGPREGFSETLRTNTALLRRIVKSPDLTLEPMKVGRRTRTDVAIVYLRNLANPQLVAEVRRRLAQIDTDAILESGYIEQFIEDAPFSIFPTIGNSEKPDSVAAKILEGRVAIVVDGTPFVLTVPLLFIENFQISEDYYSRPYFTSFLRMLRFISFMISILAPAAYVALTTFHQELIPTNLLLTMTAAHEGVPFPSFVEAGLMIVIFEILREAGVRLPRPVGQAVSIVGALVIGESAVSAGLIGAPMVVVVAITAVSSFVVPAQTDSGALLRLILLVLAGFAGGFGIAIGLLGLLVHLVSLRSFGAPYLSPLAPLNAGGLKDVLIRAPLWLMIARPKAIAWGDSQRQAGNIPSAPPADDPAEPNSSESR